MFGQTAGTETRDEIPSIVHISSIPNLYWKIDGKSSFFAWETARQNAVLVRNCLHMLHASTNHTSRVVRSFLPLTIYLFLLSLLSGKERFHYLRVVTLLNQYHRPLVNQYHRPLVNQYHRSLVNQYHILLLIQCYNFLPLIR